MLHEIVSRFNVVDKDGFGASNGLEPLKYTMDDRIGMVKDDGEMKVVCPQQNSKVSITEQHLRNSNDERI